ncbi:hypothetical protein [Actinopolymorpha pittospori]|uniref:Delta 1-pyrroline-5-carboxylate dehydrogenase n=1 Tax=Actinopolymorpha pittospori TaxID=648752 RepID=A0A927N251_9ACTN|nr:hypothetical protein [Actinopolymorpha pittospori]MBE1608893.1 delta 1-pyrroline-5-carboxylate dehydrogenase [Actinopolymorpha pittospori]
MAADLTVDDERFPERSSRWTDMCSSRSVAAVDSHTEGMSTRVDNGAVITNDRLAIDQASERLRFADGDCCVNDKPSGAAVGRQPFYGSWASGTNENAGSILNLHRRVYPRAIRECAINPTVLVYSHQLSEA